MLCNWDRDRIGTSRVSLAHRKIMGGLNAEHGWYTLEDHGTRRESWPTCRPIYSLTLSSPSSKLPRSRLLSNLTCFPRLREATIRPRGSRIEPERQCAASAFFAITSRSAATLKNRVRSTDSLHR